MADPTEAEIRTRAFELWKDAGEPDGMMVDRGDVATSRFARRNVDIM